MSRADVGSYSAARGLLPPFGRGAKIIETRSRARTPGVLGHYVPSAQTTMILAAPLRVLPRVARGAPCPPPSGRPTHRVPKAFGISSETLWSDARGAASCGQSRKPTKVFGRATPSTMLPARRTANYGPRTVDGGRLCHDRRSRATCPTSMHWTQSSYSQSIHDGRRDTRSFHSQRRDIPMSGSPASTTSTDCTVPPNPSVGSYFPTRWVFPLANVTCSRPSLWSSSDSII